MTKHALLADANDLDGWAQRLDSQAELPRLVRRLVLGSKAKLTRASFRAGEGGVIGGWDGITASETADPLVPAGVAGWELSVRKDVKTKADEDYRKRASEIEPLAPESTTFVFVTARRWAGKEAWVAARRAEGRFRDVAALDADDLEAMLELQPAVHLWFSSSIGKKDPDATALEAWWMDWTQGTRPAINAPFVLAGRRDTASAVQRMLNDSSPSFAIKAESADESLAVLAAGISTIPDEERERCFARAIVLRTSAALDVVATADSGLLLVPLFDHSESIVRAIRQGHRVVLPVGVGHQVTNTTLVVPRIAIKEAKQALIDEGVPPARAEELATLGRRSLLALIRETAIRPEVRRPRWAQPENARAVLPLLFVGHWTESSEADLAVLGEMAEIAGTEVQALAARWAREADAPVRSTGAVWYITAKPDVWRQLGGFVTRPDLERFVRVASAVLRVTDPRLDTPAREWWRSGRTQQHSEVLRRGIAETVAAIGSMGSTLRVAGDPIEQAADRIVRAVLGGDDFDWKIWASLASNLALLAEGSPHQFLAAVERGLGDGQPIMRLFEEQEGLLFRSSFHSGLLWAIERLTWSHEHMPRAALVLARLTRLDPGGQLANRPKNSLKETFVLWHPQTSADWPEQLQSLRMILDREPSVGWSLLADLLPKSHDTCTARQSPEWRDWAPNAPIRVSPSDHARRVRDVSECMLDIVGDDGLRWIDLIKALPNLPQDVHRVVLVRLSALDVAEMRATNRTPIWNALRELIAHHRAFPDADWALPKESLEYIESIWRRFEPFDVRARFAWLFDHRVELPTGRAGGWDERHRAVTDARRAAVEAVFEAEGTLGIESLVHSVGAPHFLGLTFGASGFGHADESGLLQRHLASADAKHCEFARGFAVGRGTDWIERQFSAPTLSTAQRAALLTCLPMEPKTWAMAAADAAVDAAYWQSASPYFRGTATDIEQAARKLIAHGRAAAAVPLIGYDPTDGIRNEALIADILEAALSQSAVEVLGAGFAYEVGEMLDVIEKSPTFDETRLARLQFAYAPILRSDRPPTILHRAMARDASFFADLIALLFRPEGAETVEVSEDGRRRAATAFHVLESWRTVPGAAGGTLDGAALRAWAIDAFDRTADRGLSAIGAERIGELFSHAPVGADGAWPHEEVRRLVEERMNEHFERGISIGRFNQRGVYTRAIDEGGRQEHSLADRYARWATAIRSRWPRTATVLDGLARTYRSEAGRQDIESELREDGFWG